MSTVGVVAAGMFLVLCRVQPGSLLEIGLLRNIYMHHLHYMHCILILMLQAAAGPCISLL
jgi:hypothetical protein